MQYRFSYDTLSLLLSIFPANVPVKAHNVPHCLSTLSLNYCMCNDEQTNENKKAQRTTDPGWQRKKRSMSSTNPPKKKARKQQTASEAAKDTHTVKLVHKNFTNNDTSILFCVDHRIQ